MGNLLQATIINVKIKNGATKFISNIKGKMARRMARTKNTTIIHSCFSILFLDSIILLAPSATSDKFTLTLALFIVLQFYS